VRLKVTFHVPANVGPAMADILIRGQELEADAYHIDPRLGTLTISKVETAGVVNALVVYAPGVWRSIADVGALNAAIAATRSTPEQVSENPRRSQEARQARTA
jgi:hypothetical protein